MDMLMDTGPYGHDCAMVLLWAQATNTAAVMHMVSPWRWPLAPGMTARGSSRATKLRRHADVAGRADHGHQRPGSVANPRTLA
jgi:hypothetical protein